MIRIPVIRGRRSDRYRTSLSSCVFAADYFRAESFQRRRKKLGVLQKYARMRHFERTLRPYVEGHQPRRFRVAMSLRSTSIAA